MIKVSVIIPVWNQPILLRRAVNSLPLDTDIEVIIIDDGSTDNTWQIAQTLSEHPKVHCIHLKENCGVSAARNIGIEHAKGEYLYMLDSDDYVYTNNFRNAMNMLDGTDLVYINFILNNNLEGVIAPSTRDFYAGQVKFIKKAFLKDIRYPVGINFEEDKIFSEQLLAKNPTEKFTCIPVLHYNYPRMNSLTDIERNRLGITIIDFDDYLKDCYNALHNE